MKMVDVLCKLTWFLLFPRNIVVIDFTSSIISRTLGNYKATVRLHMLSSVYMNLNIVAT